jgi:hypothetical protein
MIPVDAGEILDVFGPRVNILSSLELGEAELTLMPAPSIPALSFRFTAIQIGNCSASPRDRSRPSLPISGTQLVPARY